METITGNGLSAEDCFQVQTKQGNLLLKFRCNQEGGGRNGNDTRVASTVRCNWGELS